MLWWSQREQAIREAIRLAKEHGCQCGAPPWVMNGPEDAPDPPDVRITHADHCYIARVEARSTN
jgi:hypothetical protein